MVEVEVVYMVVEPVVDCSGLDPVSVADLQLLEQPDMLGQIERNIEVGWSWKVED